MFAIVDCNNFYASCERLFQPALGDKPILVLSNNDGCVIARSNEAKALGIKMGAPYFEIKALCKQHKVHVFSSNYSFYGDMSRRVMSVIEASWPEVEVYSIDEAFLDLTTLAAIDHEVFCTALQEKIRRHTGIPVSIGIGPTKTLAKLANHIAKRELKIPVFNIDNQRFWLAKIAVSDIWGVGRQWDKKLVQQGIYTAEDLAFADVRSIKERFSVVLQRTVYELRGIVCTGLQGNEPRKSVISSRSFGCLQTQYAILAEAISGHCANACEKLRQEGLLARHVSLFVQTNRFRQDLPQYSNSLGVNLIYPSNDVRYITRTAKLGLRSLFRQGFHYQKVGVCLGDLVSNQSLQMDLFNQPQDDHLEHAKRLMSVMDAVNNKFGRHTLHLAAEGRVKPWAMRSQLRSQAYTSKWSELPIVVLDGGRCD